MAKNYEENPADFHGSAFQRIFNLQVPTKLIANCHLDGLSDNHSLKRYHHFIFGMRKIIGCRFNVNLKKKHDFDIKSGKL
jgi:hypothetical protein